uniref:PORR domain-containing protein n=1 Tax=Fagus sylvatica TaxID=28930 RepID=A0A2N9J379_FAGSY
MKPQHLLSSPSTSSSPLFISYKYPFLPKPILSVKSHFSLSTIQPEKSQFWGTSLVLQQNNNLRKTHVPFGPIRAVVKRRKELPFDNVIQRDKKLKLVLKIRKILVSQPDRIMSLRELGRYRRDLGLDKKRRFIALLKKFPAVFEIVEEGVYSLKFKLTPEAERIYLEEMRIRNEMEDLLVIKLRKLLMMSLEKRILLEKIAHLRTDFGFPLEFRDTICHRYPQYFRVVPTERGPALELTHWDPELAVSAAELTEEENTTRELEEQNLIIDRPPRFKRVLLPKGLNLSKGETRKISQFRDMPYISPYSDFSALRFSQQLRGMLIRHPDLFYVSLKGDRDSVFLREAYRDSNLIEKDRLLLIKEKLRSLVSVPRFPNRGARRTDEDGPEGINEPKDGSGEEGEEEWSDVDNLMGDEGVDYDDDDNDDEDYEDIWGDEDDDTPPDFDEDGGTVKIGVSNPIKRVDNSTKNEDKALEPVLPDGRPRERW